MDENEVEIGENEVDIPGELRVKVINFSNFLKAFKLYASSNFGFLFIVFF